MVAFGRKIISIPYFKAILAGRIVINERRTTTTF